MAQLPHPVDCAQIAPNSLEPVTGKHLSHIIESSMEATKSGGQMIVFKLQVLAGPFKGRTVYDRLNVVNASEKAMEIAYSTLSAIGHAAGVMHIADSTQVHNIPMLVSYAPDGTYTKVTSYEKAGSAPASPSIPAPAQVENGMPGQTPAPPASNSAKPWERGGAA